MQTIAQGAQSLRLLTHLNADRILMALTLFGALSLGAHLVKYLF